MIEEVIGSRVAAGTLGKRLAQHVPSSVPSISCWFVMCARNACGPPAAPALRERRSSTSTRDRSARSTIASAMPNMSVCTSGPAEAGGWLHARVDHDVMRWWRVPRLTRQWPGMLPPWHAWRGTACCRTMALRWGEGQARGGVWVGGDRRGRRRGGWPWSCAVAAGAGATAGACATAAMAWSMQTPVADGRGRAGYRVEAVPDFYESDSTHGHSP